MSLRLTILGSNSAIPTATRFPTAQLLDIYQSFYLIDCGEGTQMQLRRNHIKLQRIGAIFISHMHGDHFFGLPGLLNTMHLLGRRLPLHLYGPPGLWDFIQITLDEANTKFTYELIFHPLTFGESKVIHEDKFVTVSTIPLDHRIPCNGFLFKETPKRLRINKHAQSEYDIPVAQLGPIKDGADLTLEDGRVIPNADLTLPPHPSRSYAFCSDTKYNERIVPIIQGVDLLYHEATFLENMRDRAKATYHSTAKDAARIATMAGVGQLLIGHYSARYHKMDDHLTEAREIFKKSDLAIEGKVFEVQ